MNSKRIKFLQDQIPHHKNKIMQYENCDAFGAYEKAEPHYAMVKFFKDWIKDIEGETLKSPDQLTCVARKAE